MSIVRGSPVNWIFKGPILISFNQPGDPGDRWTQFIDAMTKAEFTHCIGTGLGAIEVNSLQRKDASAALKGKKVVVIIDHAVARGIATALGWLGMNIKGYDWTRIREAVEYLAVPNIVVDEIMQAVLDLRDASLPSSSLRPPTPR